MTTPKRDWEEIAKVIQEAGGEIIGRTKLQKITYLLSTTGELEDFEFEYYHFGPYSEEVTEAVGDACIMGLISEEEKKATWGGRYSVFKSTNNVDQSDTKRSAFIKEAASINAIDLELAATAVYLAKEENCKDPWHEVSVRKPEKATSEHLRGAKEAYKNLSRLDPRLLQENMG